MNRRSLTFRLVSWYCGLLFALGAAFAVFTYFSFDRYIEQTMHSQLDRRADAVWDMAKTLLDDRQGLGRLAEQRFSPEALNRLIRIRSGDDVYYQSGVPSDGEFDPSTVGIASTNGPVRFEKQDNLFLLAKKFTTPDGKTFVVESGQSDSVTNVVEKRLFAVLIISLPVMLAIAALGGYMLVQRALSPVEGMIKAAEALTFNSPRNRLPLAGTEDRIDVLGRSLNRMLERLDNSYQHASRFSADAAHELRTPLAIMRGEMELLASQNLPEEMLAPVENILGETARLSQIVESLIAMAQMEGGEGKRAHHAVDLKSLTVETIDQMKLLADEKSIAIVPPSGPSVAAAGDRDRLKRVLVNLLDNAIKYTAPGGRITVNVEQSDKAAVLSVADTGIGIPSENLPHIFDRFYRVATDRGEVGAGLGLAIVKSICTAHGGTVTVESSLGSGSCFKVTLPLASLVPISPTASAA